MATMVLGEAHQAGVDKALAELERVHWGEQDRRQTTPPPVGRDVVECGDGVASLIAGALGVESRGEACAIGCLRGRCSFIRTH